VWSELQKMICEERMGMDWAWEGRQVQVKKNPAFMQFPSRVLRINFPLTQHTQERPKASLQFGSAVITGIDDEDEQHMDEMRRKIKKMMRGDNKP